MALINTTFRIYKTVDYLTDLVSSLGDCFVKCLEDGNVYVNNGGVFKKVAVASGTPDGTKFLKDDEMWAAPPGGGSAITGEIKMWPTTTAPTGYLLCDGAAVSRTTYSNLFVLISTTFGVGDGSTTFNLPNFKGKTPVGLDGAQTEFDTMAETGGEKTHTLTEAEMPAHIHDEYQNSATTGGLAGWGARDTSTNTAIITDYNTGSAGGGQTHNNLQPYLTINFIIKT